MLGYLVAHHHRWIALKALKAVIEFDWPHYAQYFVSTLLSTISNWGEKTNRPTCLESKSWFALSLFWICLIRLGCVNCRFQLTSKILYSRSLDQTKSCLYTNSFFFEVCIIGRPRFDTNQNSTEKGKWPPIFISVLC